MFERNTLSNIKAFLQIFYGHPSKLYPFFWQENDLLERMTKLLNERKVFCTVDSAYEALDCLQEPDKTSKNNIQFKGNLYYNKKILLQVNLFLDELDEFEIKLPVTKTLLDIFCELLADVKDTSLAQETVIKSILLLFGNEIEQKIINQTNDNIDYWCSNANIPPESRKIETLSVELDQFVDMVISGFPGIY